MSGTGGEIAAIETIRRGLPRRLRGETWIGDDSAVVARPADGSLLLASDVVVQGVHFDLDLVEVADVGWKALAVNVSDIAAMGGRPLHALVTVVGASACNDRGAWSEDSPRPLRPTSAPSSAEISPPARASSSRWPLPGPPVSGKPVLRSKAQPGDLLFVTGALGTLGCRAQDSCAPRTQATGDPTGAEELRRRAYAGRRLPRPSPEWARDWPPPRGGATAMIDVSDGLGIDLDRLATASGVGVVLDGVPTAEGATRDEALAGGEDYELAFAAPDAEVVARTFRAAGLRPPIRIGECVSDVALRRIGRRRATRFGVGTQPQMSPRRKWAPSSASKGSGWGLGEDATGRLYHPACPDARGAHVQVRRRPLHEGADPLDVRVPATLRAPMGVGHVHPEARVLPTDLTYGCHVDAFLEREFLQMDEV